MCQCQHMATKRTRRAVTEPLNGLVRRMTHGIEVCAIIIDLIGAFSLEVSLSARRGVPSFAIDNKRKPRFFEAYKREVEHPAMLSPNLIRRLEARANRRLRTSRRAKRRDMITTSAHVDVHHRKMKTFREC